MSAAAGAATAAAASTAAAAGFHGKVPSRGDFVRRGLPGAFVEPWDRWLQAGIAQSRAQLADEWLTIYLTSPIWRFALAPGVCGDAAVAGVLTPSVDGVGRYFPLTLAAPLPPGRPSLLALAGESSSAAWFDGAEELARRALEDDDLDPDALAAALAALGAPEGWSGPSPPPPPGAFDRGWWVDLRADDGGRADPEAIPAVADALLERACEAASVWWTPRGSERVRPSLALCAGLPWPEGFAALLDGRWDRWGWAELPTAAAAGAPA